MTRAKTLSEQPQLSLVAGGKNHAIDLPDGVAGGFLRSVLDSSPDCIKVIDFSGTLTFMNSNGCKAMQIDDFDAVRGRSWHQLWPESAAPKILESVNAAREGRATRFEAFCPTAKGAPRWWDVSVAPVFDEKGEPISIVSISRDVTDRVHQENRIRLHELELQNLAVEQAEALREKEQDLEEKKVLLREVDHRMKNSLGMITALLRSDSRSAGNDEAREKISTAASRVASIASVHEHLFMDGNRDDDSHRKLDMPSYLTALCRDISATTDEKNVELNVDCDPIALDSGQAVTMGLLVSELIMNAMRHGAKNSGRCHIDVEMRETPEGRKVTVSDDGCGLPDGFAMERSTGLGMKVLAMSAQRLKGQLKFGNREKGSFFELTF